MEPSSPEVKRDPNGPQRPPGRQLESTSQGNKFDIPPEIWIREELLRFGVIGESVSMFFMEIPIRSRNL
jgi:hypothetical protein